MVKSLQAVLGLTLAGVVLGAALGEAEERVPELGRVSWQRDLDRALQQSAETGRPVLVLFQEVPG